MGMHN